MLPQTTRTVLNCDAIACVTTERDAVAQKVTENCRVSNQAALSCSSTIGCNDNRCQLVYCDSQPVNLLSDSTTCLDMTLHDDCRKTDSVTGGSTLENAMPMMTEISYEEFLTSHNVQFLHNREHFLKCSDNVQTVVGESPEAVIEMSNPGQQLTPESHPPTQEDENETEKGGNLLPGVKSKDIRKFFSASYPMPTLSPNKNHGISLKVKAEMHCQPGKGCSSSAYVKKYAATDRHAELARWQRSTITITDADLDIEMLESVVEEINYPKLDRDRIASSLCFPRKGDSNENNERNVNFECASSDRLSKGTNISTMACENVACNSDKWKGGLTGSPELADNRASLAATHNDVEYIAHQAYVDGCRKQRYDEKSLPAEVANDLKNAEDTIVFEMDTTNSDTKLVDIFTPRSQERAEVRASCVKLDLEREYSKPDAGPVRRQSSRLLAKAAADTLAVISQESSKKQPENWSVDNESDSDVEIVDPGTVVERSCVKQKRGTKLAPIFEKLSKPVMKTSVHPPVLTEAQLEAFRVRREFLTSGIPDELKRQQEACVAMSFCANPTPWPTDAHIQQKSDLHLIGLDSADVWDLPAAGLDLEQFPEFVEPVTPHSSHLLDLPNVDETNESFQFQSPVEVAADVKCLILNEIQSSNKQFPVDRFYKHLSIKKKEVETCMKIAEDGDSIMWTDKYAPKCASEVVGNWSASRKIRDWLIQWKERIARFAEKEVESTKPTSCSNCDDYSFESFDSDCSSVSSLLCNTIVLCGPHGIGKTAMVYAVANEIGFKVFEVNSSSQRDGKHIQLQLQEATQSHQVSRSLSGGIIMNSEQLTPGEAAMIHSAHCDILADVKKTNEAKSSKQSPFASIFKKAIHKSTMSAGDVNSMVATDCRKLKNAMIQKKCDESKIDMKPNSKKCGVESTDKSAPPTDSVQTSLILFDEVDVVLSEDRGFWNAVETFMAITKRPILLTCSDPHFINRFSGRVEWIKLHVPKMVNTASYLQTVCLVENVRTSFSDLLSLTSLLHGDIRSALLLLQAWVQTGASSNFRMTAPIYMPCIDQKSSACSNTAQSCMEKSVCSTSSSHLDLTGDDDFTPVYKTKRRRVQVINSDDEIESSDFVIEPATKVRVIEKSLKSASRAAVEESSAVSGSPRMALEAELSPPVHQLFLDHVHQGRSQFHCNITGDVVHTMLGISGSWQSKYHMFDHMFVNMALNPSDHAENTLLTPNEDVVPDIKTLAVMYEKLSQMDCLYSMQSKEANFKPFHPLCIHPGIDDKLSGEDKQHMVQLHQGDIMELTSIVSDLLQSAARKWYKRMPSSLVVNCQSQPSTHLVLKYEKLADDIQCASDYVISHSIGHSSSAYALDILPVVRMIAQSESDRKIRNNKRRFYHYLRSLFPDMKDSVFSHFNSAFC